MSKLVLRSSQVKQIQHEGSAAYPNECCGVIVGRDVDGHRLVEGLRPLTNSFEEGEQYHRFRLDPLELARAEKEAGARGQLVLGFYHSHPDHPARPSEYDRQYAWPFYSYVIVAIEKGAAKDMTSWKLNETTEQFESEEIYEPELRAS